MNIDKHPKYKMIEIMQSKFEATTGIKILTAYQCIYCGIVFDNINQCSEHGLFCHNKNKINDKNIE